MKKPISYNASGPRRRVTLPVLFIALIAIFLAAFTFALTIVNIFVPRAVPLPIERPRAEAAGQRLGHLRARFYTGFDRWLPHGRSTLPAAPVRQTMYSVVIRAVATAILGPGVGWGGRVRAA